MSGRKTIEERKTLMRFGAVLTAMFSLLLACASGHAQDMPLSEYQVKAAFIFNFAKYVEWPPKALSDPKAPLCIGIFGENPFGDKLVNFLRDKNWNDHPLTVKECRSFQEATNCNVLFVSASESSRVPELLSQLKKFPVLTVSETDTFIKDGGMINFFREGNKFRFEIKDQAAKEAGLKIASKLLELSRKPPS